MSLVQMLLHGAAEEGRREDEAEEADRLVLSGLFLVRNLQVNTETGHTSKEAGNYLLFLYNNIHNEQRVSSHANHSLQCLQCDIPSQRRQTTTPTQIIMQIME